MKANYAVYPHADDDYTLKQQLARFQFIIGLRQLANALENNPALPIPNYAQNIDVYLDDDKAKETFKAAVIALGGTKKHATDWDFSMHWNFSPMIGYRLYSNRSSVCERVVVGTKVIPAKEAYVVKAQPERHEDVVEWKCSSILDDKE